ncbi:outer membrane protein OmpA-like peptidoglycan-associated protein [Paucibacter oligotrophus]|uniref:Outer membrane protein OmpA-like peptidoglycan-associated protein n=1 Tax=Roseateles oligotrophus TaxID=1769250 RepID=A0A840LDV7_9BURK|nr:OmpA family protein [Roseateles oligotrophus]MBB4843507.1 outer membrane protein OmpA-like peptidoglycan-associated protein [Roseateles oligotrophus]
MINKDQSCRQKQRRTSLHLLMLSSILLFSACAQTPPIPKAKPEKYTAVQVNQFRALGFVETDEGWELNLNTNLLFEFDSDRLQPHHIASIQRVAQAMQASGIEAIRIEGHTDNVGSPDYNQRLSQRRAHAVAQTLVEAGMKAAQMQVKGFGAQKPITDSKSEAGRAQNRRVILIIPAV